MNVWIVNPYGGLPSEGWRDYRSYMLAKALVDNGHRVSWWISDFEHRSKEFRDEKYIDLTLEKLGVSLHIVSTCSYKSNISLRRIFYEFLFGWNFLVDSKFSEKPDLIVMAYPSLFFGWSVLRYKRLNNSKMVLDILDLWPELFRVVLWKPFRSLDKLIFYPLYKIREATIRSSDAVVAVTKDYISSRVMDERFSEKKRLVSYLGVDQNTFLKSTLNNVLIQELKDFIGSDSIAAVYSGTLGQAYDIDTVCKAIQRLSKNGIAIKFIFVGAGPAEDKVKRAAKEYPNMVKYLGTLSSSDLPSVYGLCDIGVCSYVEGSTVSMPVKFYDYLVAGLGTLNSLSNEISELIASNNLGINYCPGDVGSLCKAILKLVNDKNLLASMKASAKELSTNFDSNVQHIKYVNFLEEL